MYYVCNTIKILKVVNNPIISHPISFKYYTTEKYPRVVLDEVAKELKFTQLSDWYSLSSKDFHNKVGTTATSATKIYNVVSNAYPEYEWLPWKFTSCPRNFWTDRQNQENFMSWASKELKIKELNDWYSVSYQEFSDLGGRRLLEQYSHSLYKVLVELYPHYNWLPWRFDWCPRNYWNDPSNQKKFMNWAFKELNLKDMGDWYRVSYEDIANLGGKGLIIRSSIPHVLSAVYPEFNWLPWKFDSCPRNFWEDPANQRSFMNWTAKQLNIKEMSDWYNVTYQQVLELGGYGLLKQNSKSLSKVLQLVYPEHEWLPWKFSKVTDWENTDKRMLLIKTIEKELNVKQHEDWYNVTKEDLARVEGGSRILNQFKSLYKLLVNAYPDYCWLPWRFPLQKHYWADSTYWKYFIEAAAKNLGVQQLSDWYNVTAKDIIDLGGGTLIIENKTLPLLLARIYPDFNWDTKLFTQVNDIWTDVNCANYFVDYLKTQDERSISYAHKVVKNMRCKTPTPLTQLLKSAFPDYIWISTLPSASKKSQYILKQSLKDIFGNDNTVLLEEHRYLLDLNLELDYFFPQYNLAIEYQGLQHYKNVNMYHKKESVDTFKSRDINKDEVCKLHGITLIKVPYWWDKKTSSLAASIYNVRPDLFAIKPEGLPIPLTTPAEPITGDNILKKLFMNATDWDASKMEPKGWYMTEKYDGMRLYWTGNTFYSRQGEKVQVPEYIKKQLPPVALDGELWTQYGLYQDAIALSRSNKAEKWTKAVFWVFDAPRLKNKILEERIEYLRNLKLPTFAKVVDFVKCEGREHLEEFTNTILKKGGEGVMLREPGSLYKPGRSSCMRRNKPYFDTEVKVVRNQYPFGFACKMENGKPVFVKTAESEEAKNLKEGAVITVKHSGTNIHGTLLYPQFYRERLDFNWNNVNK